MRRGAQLALLLLTASIPGLFFGLSALGQGTPDGETPTEESVCDGLEGNAFGICNAYCEAKDCVFNDIRSCDVLRDNFERLTGSPLLPCDDCDTCLALADSVVDCDLFDDGEANGSCVLCGNDRVGVGEECDGTADAACPNFCLSDCTCPATIVLPEPENIGPEGGTVTNPDGAAVTVPPGSFLPGQTAAVSITSVPLANAEAYLEAQGFLGQVTAALQVGLGPDDPTPQLPFTASIPAPPGLDPSAPLKHFLLEPVLIAGFSDNRPTNLIPAGDAVVQGGRMFVTIPPESFSSPPGTSLITPVTPLPHLGLLTRWVSGRVLDSFDRPVEDALIIGAWPRAGERSHARSQCGTGEYLINISNSAPHPLTVHVPGLDDTTFREGCSINTAIPCIRDLMLDGVPDPPVCGDGFTQICPPANEHCDGADDGSCPGECPDPEEPGECRCDCDDGDACTGVESGDLISGCQLGTPLFCNDGNVCTGDGSCDPIFGCGPPLDCDDGNACTVDSCDSLAGCQHEPLDCDDGSVCNGVESCDPITGCQPGTPLDCNDGNVCTVDSCSAEGGCEHVPNDECTNFCFVDPFAGCIPGVPDPECICP